MSCSQGWKWIETKQLGSFTTSQHPHSLSFKSKNSLSLWLLVKLTHGISLGAVGTRKYCRSDGIRVEVL